MGSAAEVVARVASLVGAPSHTGTLPPVSELFDRWQDRIDALVREAVGPSAKLPAVPFGADETDRVMVFVRENLAMGVVPGAVLDRLDGGVIDALMGHDILEGHD